MFDLDVCARNGINECREARHPYCQLKHRANCAVLAEAGKLQQ
jgi:hypothetical protein